MRTTIFDADIGWEAFRGIPVAEEAEGDSGGAQVDGEADAGRSIEAYRPPLPELPIRGSEEEDAEDELLDTSPYPQPGEWGFEWKAGHA